MALMLMALPGLNYHIDAAGKVRPGNLPVPLLGSFLIRDYSVRNQRKGMAGGAATKVERRFATGLERPTEQSRLQTGAPLWLRLGRAMPWR